MRASALTQITIKELIEALIDDYLPDLIARHLMEARPDVNWNQRIAAAEIGNLLTKDAPWRYTRADAAKALRGIEEAAIYRRNTT